MNPYEKLEPQYFWRTGCANKSPFDIYDLWKPKFKIARDTRVVTYGSCFAQHLGKALRDNGFSWLIKEPSPIGLSDNKKRDFGYEVFSTRTGNIYTTSLLNQWCDWVNNPEKVPDEVWEQGERYFDPFRPNIEENGFSSIDEVINLRNNTIKYFGSSIKSADVFVFTLGLTESWINNEKGYEYPMCPGTAAGVFDSTKHQFVNLSYKSVLESLMSSIRVMREINPKLKFILTVSPVPLTATMSGEHVLTATMKSKSILRAVAQEATERKAYVDYFPSYEIINSPVFKGMFFEPNLRSVNPAGVSHVMKNFFWGMSTYYGVEVEDNSKSRERNDSEVCEEQLLSSFQGNDTN